MITIEKSVNPSDTLHPTPWEEIFRWRDTTSINNQVKTFPPVTKLYIKGENVLLNKPNNPRVLIIGNNDNTEYGKNCTLRIIKALANNPLKSVILSGLSFGISTIAHETALAVGLPTVAVLPTDLDNVYPHKNKDLAKRIVDSGNGCLITPFEKGTTADINNFSIRNRTMALMADFVIVVESRSKGHSFMTAMFASMNSCPVFAIPNNISEKRSQGCLELIMNNHAEILYDFDLLEDPNYLTWGHFRI